VDAGQGIYIKGSDLLDLFDENAHMGYTVMRNITGDVSARLTQTRQRLSTEWLSSGMLSPASNTAWGEPKRR
jgi:hypothetical protein